MPEELIVEAHGSFASQRCIECKSHFDGVELRKHIKQKKIPLCTQCGGLVKPDIVFFGEQVRLGPILRYICVPLLIRALTAAADIPHIYSTTSSSRPPICHRNLTKSSSFRISDHTCSRALSTCAHQSGGSRRFREQI